MAELSCVVILSLCVSNGWVTIKSWRTEAYFTYFIRCSCAKMVSSNRTTSSNMLLDLLKYPSKINTTINKEGQGKLAELKTKNKNRISSRHIMLIPFYLLDRCQAEVYRNQTNFLSSHLSPEGELFWATVTLSLMYCIVSSAPWVKLAMVSSCCCNSSMSLSAPVIYLIM